MAGHYQVTLSVNWKSRTLLPMAGRKVDTPARAPGGGAEVEALGDIPDLALPAPVPAPARPRPGVRATSAAMAGGGRELDEDDPFGLAGGGAPIELDSQAAPPPQSMRIAPAARASGTMAAVTPPHSVVSIEVDRYDARVLADFGEPPQGLLSMPLYAFRVKTRQIELRRALSTRRSEAERVNARLEDALVAFGERVRAILEKTPGHHRMLEDVIAAEQLAMERDGKLAGEMNAHRTRAAAMDARLAPLEAALESAKEEERQLAEAVTRAETARGGRDRPR
jgi:hypothetical protein